MGANILLFMTVKIKMDMQKVIRRKTTKINKIVVPHKCVIFKHFKICSRSREKKRSTSIGSDLMKKMDMDKTRQETRQQHYQTSPTIEPKREEEKRKEMVKMPPKGIPSNCDTPCMRLNGSRQRLWEGPC